MPFYEVQYACPLAKAQRDELAQAITHIHTRKFCTPSLFVNIRFTDSSSHCNYIGGEERPVSRVVGVVRAGGPRKTADFGELAQEILMAWNRIINNGKKGHGEYELKVVTIQASITAALESGFHVPQAGGDSTWLKANKAEFEKLASEGDSDFVKILSEMQNRDDLAQALRAQSTLE